MLNQKQARHILQRLYPHIRTNSLYSMETLVDLASKNLLPGDFSQWGTKAAQVRQALNWRQKELKLNPQGDLLVENEPVWYGTTLKQFLAISRRLPKRGQPMRYRKFIEILHDDTLYSPAAAAHWGDSHGLFRKAAGIFPKTLRGHEKKAAILRVRTSLSRYVNYHLFSRLGDGIIYQKGQGATAAWYGSTWKRPLQPRNDRASV